MEQLPNYYAVIPANIRYDRDLSSSVKLLYAEITALCNKSGYCWASNTYFADLYNVHKNTISEWVSTLKDKKYIDIELESNGREGRKIYIATGKAEGTTPKSRRYLREKPEPSILINNKNNITAEAVREISFEEFMESKGFSWNEYRKGDETWDDWGTEDKPLTPAKVKELKALWKPAPKKVYQKPVFSFKEELERMRTSDNEVEKRMALIWYHKGYDFDNYEQYKAQFGMDKQFISKLVGYDSGQIKRAIEKCKKDSEGKYDWKASTVAKVIAEIK